MEKNLKENFEKLLETIDELDWDDLVETLSNLDEVYWKDNYYSITLIKKVLDLWYYELDDYGLCFIPEYFWENRDNAIDAIEYIASLDNFNLYSYVPSYIWEDEHDALYVVSLDYTGLGNVSDNLSNYQEIVHLALDRLEEKIEDSYYNGPAYPWDSREHLEWLMQDVSPSLKNDKDFIIDVLNHDYFSDVFDVIYRWVDQKLWSDKEFVINVIELCGYSEMLAPFIDESLLNDQDIKSIINN